MVINFILPGAENNPCGGFKVVYEYANGLARRGHQVRVVHAPHRLPEDPLWKILRSRGIFVARRLGVDHGFRPDHWFNLDPEVEVIWARSLFPQQVPPADVVVATSWESAEWIAGYPRDRGEKSYLIQHFETFFKNTEPERVIATWRAPLKKIVISRWLLDKAHEFGENAEYIPNGLDFHRFGLDQEITNRDPFKAMMLFHSEDWKGSAQGIEALKLAKAQAPGLTVNLFGVPLKPTGLPEWMSYHRTPTQWTLRSLYNESAIFMAPSWAEGWPLPPAEAAQCGCALALTDIGGHREYAVHEQTALLSPIRDSNSLAANIIRLLTDQELRFRLARAAHQNIQQFTWDRAVNSLETFLLGETTS